MICFNLTIVDDFVVERDEAYLLALTSNSSVVANSSSIMNVVYLNIVQDDCEFELA